jgi:hypothetical protein
LGQGNREQGTGNREQGTGNRKRVLSDFTFLHIPLNFSVHLLIYPENYKEERRKPLKMWVTQEATFGL